MMDTLRDITLGSWLTAALIILIRIVFGKLISHRARYLLWLLLAVRLCMPGLLESSGSVENLAVWQDFSETVEYQMEETVEKLNVIPAAETTVETVEKKHTPSPLLIWGLGMSGCFLCYAGVAAATFLRLKKAVPVHDQEALHALVRVRGRLGVTRDIQLCYGEETLIGGLRKPVLLIPRELSGVELDAAFTHELMHYVSGDLWVAALWRVLCCIYWFNPVVWLCSWWSKQDCEKACDQRVLALGAISPSAYAQLLYREGKMKRTVQIGTTAFGRSNLKARIKALTKLKKPALWMTVVAAALYVFVVVFTMTGEKTAKESLPETRTYQFHLHSSDFILTEPGEQIVLTYTLKPVDAEIAWSTDDDSVAYVNEYEVLTAVGPGTCTLKAVSGNTTVERTVTCDFEVDVTDSSFIKDTLYQLLTVGDTDIFAAFHESEAEGSYEPLNKALKETMGDIIRTDLSATFYSGRGVGKLWKYGWQYDYTTTCDELTITKGMNTYLFGYEAVITVSSDEFTRTIPISGEVTYNRYDQITSVTVKGNEIEAFYAELESGGKE